jgi:hypothetical protein
MVKALRAVPVPASEALEPERPRPLTRAEEALLAEALRLGEEAREAAEDALVAFGRWVLVHVFDNDAAAAIAHRGANPVWCELRRRAGGPTLHLSERLLYVALLIAAHDKRITDENWRNLEPGRKALLLPLREVDALREAAQHVSALKLSHHATRTYVDSLLEARGRDRKPRFTAASLTRKVRSFRGGLSGAAFTRRLQTVSEALSAPERRALAAELEGLRHWCEAQLDAVRRAPSGASRSAGATPGKRRAKRK